MVLSVGPNPNSLILSSCPDLPSIRQQLRSICGKYRIAVSPAPGSQNHKEASHPIREADVYVCCQVFRAAFYLFSASFSYCWVSKYLSVMFKHLLTGHRSYLLKYLNICHVKPLSYGNNPGRIRGRLIRWVWPGLTVINVQLTIYKLGLGCDELLINVRYDFWIRNSVGGQYISFNYPWCQSWTLFGARLKVILHRNIFSHGITSKLWSKCMHTN